MRGDSDQTAKDEQVPRAHLMPLNFSKPFVQKSDQSFIDI